MGTPSAGAQNTRWCQNFAIFDWNLGNGTREAHDCYGTLIRSHMRSIEWPWRTLNPVLEDGIFEVEYLKNEHLKDKVYRTLIGNQSINQYLFNKSCRTQLKTAKILTMYTQYKIAEKIESYKVLCSVFFVQHTYKKVSVIQLRRLGNKFFTVWAPVLKLYCDRDRSGR